MLKAIESGFKEAAEVGPIASFSMIDLKGTLLGVEFKDPQSTSEMAFKAATSLALREAVKKAKAQLLEPVMTVEVICPDDFVGSVIGDLNSRRGKVHSMSVRPGGGQIVNCEAPLATLFGYATDLRSLSQGRASFSMVFKAYEVIPPKVNEEILTRLGR